IGVWWCIDKTSFGMWSSRDHQTVHHHCSMFGVEASHGGGGSRDPLADKERQKPASWWREISWLEGMFLFLITIVDISLFWLATPSGDALAHRLDQMDLSTSTIPGVLQRMLGERGLDGATQISQLGVGGRVEGL